MKASELHLSRVWDYVAQKRVSVRPRESAPITIGTNQESR